MNLFDKLLRLKIFKTSLRVKVMIVFVLPMILVLLVFSYIHNLREQREITEQIQTATIQMGDMALTGIKNAMLRNDQEVVNRILRNYGTNPSIIKIQIINLENKIVNSAVLSDVGIILQTDQTGCNECHSHPASDRPRVAPVKINNNVLRVITPIPNSLECQTCHSVDNKHLGVLLIDAPLDAVIEYSKDDQLYNLGISVISIALVSVLAYLMIQWLIERRIGILYKYLNAFAEGEFSVRIPKAWRTEDEITKLADYFNAIADSLEHDKQLQHEITYVRQEAIAEERDRIARELHDGVAQFIGYVNAKIMAVRLLIQKDRIEEADQQLLQIEQAVREQAVDIRASIIGLKLASESGIGLATGLHQLIDQCKRLSEYKIQIEIEPQAENIHLAPETELHLLRIVQEALSNVRKHASAEQAVVHLGSRDDELILGIQDDCIGFTPYRLEGNNHANFGIKNMYERAEMIGAILTIESAPEHGTMITVRLKIKEE